MPVLSHEMTWLLYRRGRDHSVAEKNEMPLCFSFACFTTFHTAVVTRAPSLFRDDSEIVPLVDEESFCLVLMSVTRFLRLCICEFSCSVWVSAVTTLQTFWVASYQILRVCTQDNPPVSSFWRLYPPCKSAWLWLGSSVVLGSELSSTLLGPVHRNGCGLEIVP